MVDTNPLLMMDIRNRITDLGLVVGLVVAAVIAVAFNAPQVVRVPLSLVTILALPGYVLTSALFPTDGRAAQNPVDGRPRRGLSLIEPGVLSIGFSLAVVPLVLLVVDVAGVALTTGSILAAVAVVTLLTTAVAAVRRRRTPSAVLFEPTLASVSGAGGSAGLLRMDLLTAALVLSLLFAGGAIAYPQTIDDQSATTEFYLLSPDDDGELRGFGYPTDFTTGVGESLTVGIGNRGSAETTYTVVSQLQLTDRRDNTTVVTDREELSREQVTVGANETRLLNQTVTVDSPGRYRLAFMLYQGEPPAEPTTDNAYRELHLWIDVSGVGVGN